MCHVHSTADSGLQRNFVEIPAVNTPYDPTNVGAYDPTTGGAYGGSTVIIADSCLVSEKESFVALCRDAPISYAERP